jgi:hypothetical protein
MNNDNQSFKLIKAAMGFSIVASLLMSVSASEQGAGLTHVVSNMPANSWLEIPNSRLDSVAADARKYPNMQGYSGIHGINAYSGAVFDSKRNRLVIWGGGHEDYQGNEVYAFDTDTLVWERLTDPSEPNLDKQVNSDGTPNARHTYNGMAYIEHADKLFSSGGSLAGEGSCGADKTWVFDFNSTQWTDMNPSKAPNTDCENICAYDPETQKVWWFDVPGLWSYHYDTNKWHQHNEDHMSSRTAVMDTKRGALVLVGQGEVIAYNIRADDYNQQLWDTSGGDSFIGSWAPGLAYDPVNDRIVGWSGKSVYALNPETKVWTQHSATGAPVYPSEADDDEGLYGLWRYVPNLNAFIVMTRTDTNIHFYKLTAGPDE